MTIIITTCPKTQLLSTGNQHSIINEEDNALSCISRKETVIASSSSSSPSPSPLPTTTTLADDGQFLWTQYLHLPVFVVDTSTSHRILVWNKPAEKLTGISATSVVGRPLECIILSSSHRHSKGGYNRTHEIMSSTPSVKNSRSSTRSLLDGTNNNSTYGENCGDDNDGVVVVDDESSSSTSWDYSGYDDVVKHWKQFQESIHETLMSSRVMDSMSSMSRQCEICLPCHGTTTPQQNNNSFSVTSLGRCQFRRKYQVTMSTQRNPERDDVVGGVVCFLDVPSISCGVGGGGGGGDDHNAPIILPASATTVTSTVSSSTPSNDKYNHMGINLHSNRQLQTIPIPSNNDNDCRYDDQHQRQQEQEQSQRGNLFDLQNVAAPIFGVDSDKRIQLWNDMASKLFGYTHEEIIGRQITELNISVCHKGDDDDDNNATSTIKHDTVGSTMANNITRNTDRTLEDYLDDAFSNIRTRVSDFTVAIQNPLDRSVHTVMVNILPHSDRSGNNDTHSVDGLILVCTVLDDIPSQNGVKCTLSNSQQIQQQRQHQLLQGPKFNEYQHLFETANTPIFGVNEFGIVNEWNMRMVEITGILNQDAIGGPLIESGAMSIPCTKDVVGSVLDKAYRGRGSSNVELEITTHRYGETRFFLVNVTPRRNSQNKIVGAIAIAEDVTEACNHERAVAAMANELRQLIDTANAPIFGIDRDGYVCVCRAVVLLFCFSIANAIDPPFVVPDTFFLFRVFMQ
jgi:PAS domain S-box-containing protein